MLALSQSLDAMQSHHERLTTSIRDLQDAPHDLERVTKVVECCLRPLAAPAGTCEFCAVHKVFEEYENTLFHFVDKGGATGAPENEEIAAVGKCRFLKDCWVF